MIKIFVKLSLIFIHSGLNFFPLEGEEQPWSEEYGVNPDQVSRHALLDWKAALIAWFVSGAEIYPSVCAHIIPASKLSS